MSKDYIKTNQKLWDAKTDIHYKSDFYNVDAFIAGKSSLNPIEIKLLGDVKNKTILHLQCHFGMDTISLSRLGAKTVGVDFSNKSIQLAEKLAARTHTKTQFIQSDIYKLEQKLNSEFNIVFTTYGTICWLPDLDKWARIISNFLKPGGVLIFVEFHPVLWMFSEDFSKIEYTYFNTGAIVEELPGTYADRNSPICNKSVSWNHPLSEVFSALKKNKLTIESFEEYNYSPYDCFENTVEIGKNKYQISGLENKIPMLYSIKARK